MHFIASQSNVRIWSWRNIILELFIYKCSLIIWRVESTFQIDTRLGCCSRNIWIRTLKELSEVKSIDKQNINLLPLKHNLLQLKNSIYKATSQRRDIWILTVEKDDRVNMKNKLHKSSVWDIKKNAKDLSVIIGRILFLSITVL